MAQSLDKVRVEGGLSVSLMVWVYRDRVHREGMR